MLALYRSAGGTADEFQHQAEQWFDDSMERVSGWYRRKVQWMLFVIATVVVVVLNADSLTTARVLWRDDAARSAIVVKAEAAAKEDDPENIKVNEAVKGLDVPLGWDLTFGDGSTQVPNNWLAWLAKLAGLAADHRCCDAWCPVLVRPPQQGRSDPRDRRAPSGQRLDPLRRRRAVPHRAERGKERAAG